MKVNGQIPLRFIHSESANFTLPIQKKALQPTLFPFSSKKLAHKAPKDECERHFQR
jgi:hypothetical protein